MTNNARYVAFCILLSVSTSGNSEKYTNNVPEIMKSNSPNGFPEIKYSTRKTDSPKKK